MSGKYTQQLEPWLQPHQARKYAGGICKRTWRKWKNSGLRTETIGGVVLTRASWIDSYIMDVDDRQIQSNTEAILQKLGKRR